MNIKCSILPDSSDCMKRAVTKMFMPLLMEAGYSFPEENNQRVHFVVIKSLQHGSFEILKNRIIKGQTGKVEKYIDSAITMYTDEIRKSDNLIFDKDTHSVMSGEDQIKRLVKCYYNDIAPKMVFPENCDYRNHLSLPLKCIHRDYEISGKVDVLTKYSLCSTKVSKNLKLYNLEIGGLANLLKINSIKKPKYLMTHYLPRIATEKAYTGTIITDYDYDFSTNESWYKINELINCTEQFKKSGNAACFNANPESKLCSRKYCKAYGTNFCKYFK